MKDLLTPVMSACLLLLCLTHEATPKARTTVQMWAAIHRLCNAQTSFTVVRVAAVAVLLIQTALCRLADHGAMVVGIAAVALTGCAEAREALVTGTEVRV
jgi:hypothetical protein